MLGVEHSVRLASVIDRLADTSAQIRVRLTVLLVAGLALAAQSLGFEAILGAFLAGLLVRALDPDPEHTHPRYPMKLEAVGFGLLVPIFFITSGLTLDLAGLFEQPAALAPSRVPARPRCWCAACPPLAFRAELSRRRAGRESHCCRPRRCRSCIAASEIGTEMGLLDPATAAGLVAAGLVSVLIFPAAALTLLGSAETEPASVRNPGSRAGPGR